ncbi:MAG: methylmalonyl-CoA epimerase [Bdellovibrionaceae bacterium]|nr:methylmalonyl-CoA epimerase [Bdellovibrionales bacterium]MCB9085808.1 methylmalonyl-CoA epimerase [Pseudobdellovibrionaceae bacterium]
MNLPFSYKLDHIGIAVPSLAEGGKLYEALGFSEVHVEDVVGEGVKVGTYELANDSRIELLEPLGENSPVAKFLEKRGPGVHHICLAVTGLAQILKDLKAAGVRLVYDEPRPGAHNCMISFIHPASAGGVLIELSEKKP